MSVVMITYGIGRCEAKLNVSGFNQKSGNDQDPNSIYTDYPPYPDPYISTYTRRSLSNSNWNMSKVHLCITGFLYTYYNF